MTKMGENLGQQYALQVAVQTMEERCLQLQQRLSIVEDENLHLRMKYNADCLDLSDDKNKTEVEMLREKVAQLTKQKSQLTHNVLMVSTENRQLWNRLSKLTQANQCLGNQLTKLSDTLNQCSASALTQSSASNLIRSRTFTHETPPAKIVPKIDKEMYMDTSLEDISLKILSNIAQEKTELEKQCAQMTEMQSDDSFLQNSIGFAYPSEALDECTIEELAQNVEKLKRFKESLLTNRDKLKNIIDLFKKVYASGTVCNSCKKKPQQKEIHTQASRSLDKETKPDKFCEKQTNKLEASDEEKICPICTKAYITESYNEFIHHVEMHFTTDDDNYLDTLNYEVISSTNK